MEKIIGRDIVNGKLVDIKQESFHCICIKEKDSDLRHVDRILMDGYKKGSQYEFVILEEFKSTKVSNGYVDLKHEMFRVYLTNDTNDLMDKDLFNEHFMTISDYRDKRLNEVLG